MGVEGQDHLLKSAVVVDGTVLLQLGGEPPGDTEAEVERKLSELEEPLSEVEEQLLTRYAGHLESVWKAPTTKPQDRKRIARCLIEKVVVTSPREGANLEAKVYSRGGEMTVVEVPKGKSGVHRYVLDPELVDLVRELAGEFSDAQIAYVLGRKGLKTSKGLSFRAYHVSNVRKKYSIAKGPLVPVVGKDDVERLRPSDVGQEWLSLILPFSRQPGFFIASPAVFSLTASPAVHRITS